MATGRLTTSIVLLEMCFFAWVILRFGLCLSVIGLHKDQAFAKCLLIENYIGTSMKQTKALPRSTYSNNCSPTFPQDCTTICLTNIRLFQRACRYLKFRWPPKVTNVVAIAASLAAREGLVIEWRLRGKRDKEKGHAVFISECNLVHEITSRIDRFILSND